MRRHAKASPAGPTQRQATGLGRLLRGVFADRTASDGVDGIGAPATHHGRLGVALLTVIASFGILISTASAAITHNPEPFSPLTGSGSGLTLEEVFGVAVDEATGNVFVTDGGPGHERVAILGADGGGPVGLAPPYEIAGFSFGENTTNGLAYDNSPASSARGTLYVTDRSTTAVRKFTRNPSSERYEPAGDIPVPNGTSSAALSVDRNGNLYVGAASASFDAPKKLYKFSPSGALLSTYDLSFSPGQVAVDSAGDLFVVAIQGNVYKFPADGSGEIDPSVYTPIAGPLARGVAIDPSNEHVFVVLGHAAAEYDTVGHKLDEFGTEEIGFANQVAVNSATERIYVGDASAFIPGHHDVNVFGPPLIVPTTGIGDASEVTGTKATLNGSINPEGVEVTECFFEWGEDLNGEPHYEHEAECEELPSTDSAAHLVSARISGLTVNGKAYHFRLVAKNENGTERSGDKSFVTANTVATQAATEVGATTATINGALRPEGNAYSACDFEYGLTTTSGYEHTTSCKPPAAEIAPDFSLHDVSLALSGLQVNATYKFRLTATNVEGTLSGSVLTFRTQGPPQITEVRAAFADQTSATLEAKIDPSGFGTSYRIEWGPTTSYGRSVPADFEPFIGSGEEPVSIKAKLSGLSAASTYHYRVVATSKAGTTATADREVETLNSCGPVGLPDQRCFELASPRGLGPVSAPGRARAGLEMHFQATDTPGSLAYAMEAGLEDSKKGGEVLYRATRSTAGEWESTVLSPPTTGRNEQSASTAAWSDVFGLSPDLSCGVVGSSQALSDDPRERQVAQLMDEAGGGNLYVRDSSGTYKLITDVPPEELKRQGSILAAEFDLRGLSGNCETVVFSTKNHYSGVGGLGAADRLYEWRRGVGLRYLGWVPNGAGEEEVEARVGENVTWEGNGNVVSEDGSRAFFMAPDPTEGGKQGVFVRENGTVTHDLSASETATPSTGATFQGSTPDGSRVYFTANAGLTSPSNAVGTDLYEYNFATSGLKDLSVTPDPGGADVKEVVGIAANGAHAYFTSPAQLVPGRGKTEAENQNGVTLSLYDSAEGSLRFVATVAGVQGSGLRKATRVSPTGRYLVFESTGNVTGYASGNILQAYLYDAEATDEPTVCLSCRQDGLPSLRDAGELATVVSTPRSASPGSSLYEPQALVVRGGNAKVFFRSRDRLATGAVPGILNLYEWSHGQVFTISSEPAGYTPPGTSQGSLQFAGASAGGEDLYFFSPAALNWENPEGRYAVWDARVGGGFAEPASAPPSCDPDEEGSGSCRGPEAPAPASPAAGTARFSGQGNVKPKEGEKKHRKRGHRARHGKKYKAKHGKRHGKRHGKKGHGKTARHARRNGRVGK